MEKAFLNPYAMIVFIIWIGFALPARGAVSKKNPVNKRQSRKEIFEFTVKPKVIKKGNGYEISFKTKAECDATVAVADSKGKILRHLASGVLGENAPWPFQQGSLEQTLSWDGKDNFGKQVPADSQVRVSLGLTARYERQFAFNPYDFGKLVLSPESINGYN